MVLATAVIAMLLLTALAVASAVPDTRPASVTAGVDEPDERPLVREAPPFTANLALPTADLPAGGIYSEQGAGTWHVVSMPVNAPTPPTPPAGTRVLTYAIEVEDGLAPGAYSGDATFAGDVDATLADPRSWARLGFALRRADNDVADIRISLTSPATSRQVCGGDIPFEGSCYVRPQVVINLARWVRGALAFSGDLVSYRQYVINHEVGHALGQGHEGCAVDGGPAPVMMQQTYGTANDYVAQLNGVDRYNRSAVLSDGKICRPNSWPGP